MKCGFVSIVGRPNVGKSTLLNSLVGLKLAIISDVSGTTRDVIQGIYNDSDSQIIFVDTPGIHKPMHKLDTIMNKRSYDNTEGVDLILFLIDAYSGFGKGDLFILNRIKESGIPIFLVLNKIDKIKDKTKLLEQINDLNQKYEFSEIIPLSAKKNKLNDLIKTIKKYLNESSRIYNEEELTNVSTRFIMAEFVREKVLELTHDEIPHTVTCFTEEYKEKKDSVLIRILIVVDRENIKKIIIGKQGSLLKEIGTKARIEMEKFLGKKVFLETYVKVVKSWRDNEIYLTEFGFNDDE